MSSPTRCLFVQNPHWQDHDWMEISHFGGDVEWFCRNCSLRLRVSKPRKQTIELPADSEHFPHPEAPTARPSDSSSYVRRA